MLSLQLRSQTLHPGWPCRRNPPRRAGKETSHVRDHGAVREEIIGELALRETDYCDPSIPTTPGKEEEGGDPEGVFWGQGAWDFCGGVGGV